MAKILRMPRWMKNWIKRLKSGRYHQITGSLDGNKKGNKLCFCALGLLSHSMKLDGSKDTQDKYDGVSYYKYPDSIKGCNISNYREIITMNDSNNKTFPEIAEYLEKNWRKHVQPVSS